MEKEFINGYRRMGIDIEPLEDGTVKVTDKRVYTEPKATH